MKKLHSNFAKVIPLILLLSFAFGCQQQAEKTDPEKEAKVLAIHRVAEEAWSNGNLDVVDEVFASSYVYHVPPFPDVEGPEAYKQRILGYRSAFPDLQLTIDEIVVEKNMVAYRWTFRGTHSGPSPSIPIPATGKQVTFTGCALGFWRDGKAVEEWNHANFLGLMQQLGLTLAPPQQPEKE